MLHINRVTLLGHAGRDPDIRALPDGGRAAAFSLATTEKWKRDDGGTAERTEWHRIAVYGPAVDAVETMVRKGAALLVEGRLAHREFRDRQGRDRRIAEIVVAGPRGTVNVLAGGNGSGASASPSPPDGSEAAAEAAKDPGPDGHDDGGGASAREAEPPAAPSGAEAGK